MKIKKILKKIVSGALALTLLLSNPGDVRAAGSDADRETLKAKIESVQAELDAAKKEQETRLVQYNRGLLGFIEWMETKSNLTSIQKYDLSQGKTVLQAAIEEDFSKWYGGDNTGLPARRNNKVVVVGDEYDAISLDNLQSGIDQMKTVNELRASDANYVGTMKRNPGRTNFYMMAVATSGADRGAGLRNHSLLQVSCENLAFGGNPAYMWYSEKSIFDSYKKSLNITALTSESDVTKIDKAASADGKTVGHYTNLFWSIDQLMGVGFTNYGVTGCFNASKLSNYSSRYATYSIEEFEKLYKEYMTYIDPQRYQKAVDDKQAELDGYREQYYTMCPGHTYGTVKTVAATCTEKGYTSKTCKTCGYEQRTYTTDALGHDLTDGVCARCGMTTPIKLNTVWWYLNNHTSGATNQTYEIGDVVEISMDFTSASEDKNKDKFRFDISDPTIMKYEAGKFNTGTMTMLKQGECKVTVTAVDNPSVTKVYNIEVTEKGGHNYVMNVDEDGDGKTTKTCMKCHKSVDVTVPASITSVTFRQDGMGYYSPSEYEENTEVKVQVSYSPSSVDNRDFVVEIEDPTIASYTAGNYGYTGTLKMLKPGETTITIYAKYNPSAKKTYTLSVTETGGHDYVIDIDSDGDGKTTKTCTKCHKSVDVTVPASITSVTFRQGGIGYYSPKEYEENTEVEVRVSYSPSSVDNRDFVVEIEDPTIASYTAGNYGYTGTLKMLKPGETTITIYAKYNPSAKKTYTLSVSETGGHDYVPVVDEDGDGRTTAVCSKCGKSTEVTVPAYAHMYVKDTESGNYGSVWEYSYDVGTKLDVETDVQGHSYTDLVVEVSDPEVVSYQDSGETESAYYYDMQYGEITCQKAGICSLTVYPKYNPSAKKFYTIRVKDADTEEAAFDIADAEVEIEACIARGYRCYPKYKVTYHGTMLSTEDYTVESYKGNYLPGTATMTLTGTGMFTGTKEVPFTIRQGNLEGAEISVSTSEYADADQMHPKVQSVFADGGYVSPYAYTVSYTDNASDETVTITVTGTGTYMTGTASTTVSNAHTTHIYGEWYTEQEPSCEETGVRRHDCKYCDAYETETIDALGHAYEMQFDWADDASSCTAEMVCKRDAAHVVAIPASDIRGPEMVSKQSGTCTKKETRTYRVVVTYEGEEYTDEKTVEAGDDIDPTAHPSASIVEDAAVAPTCEETGLTAGSHCKDCGAVITAQKEIPAAGHTWGTPVYTWEDETETGVATFTCTVDAAHVQTVNCRVEKQTYTAPTCEKAGTVTYKIQPFTFDGMLYEPDEVKTEEIPATGHAWETESYTWKEDGSACEIVISCKHNKEHRQRFNCSSYKSAYQAPTATEDGYVTYRVGFMYQDYVFSDTKTIVLPKTGESGDSGTTPTPGGSGDSGTTPTPGGSGDSGTTPKPGGSGDSGTTPTPGGSGDSGTTDSLPAVNVYYLTHVQTYGWQGDRDNYKTWKKNGETAGTFAEAKRLESIQIKLDTTANLGVEYRTHVQTYGWEKTYRADGAMSGTSGEAKRLEAISIRLTGADKDKYDIYYRVHAQTYGWLGWAKNGENAGTAAQAKRLEGIQIRVVPKGQRPTEGPVGYSYIELGKSSVNSDSMGMINYMTHVQSYGDQKYVYDGSVSGTFAEAKRLEGIRIKLNSAKTGYSGSVQYRTQVQTYGWRDWSHDGEMNGTVGQAKRLEAIQIRLTGDVSQHYDVYYRVHSQTYGWLGWAKNGETAGTVGLAKRLEGIQIVLVPKGQGAPNYLPGTMGMPSYIGLY